VVVTGDGRDDGDGDDAAAAALAALAGALGQLDAMRRAEGAALAVDLAARLAELGAVRDQLAARAAGLTELLTRRLTERIGRLVAELGDGDPRIAQEAAIQADRADVSEELVRLTSHLVQAGALIDEARAAAGPIPVGRRLDFLVQEIGRELNTIGAKAATAEISTAVVGGKAALEKLREQVQNVE
jgi:uncharacterized protein (TIGR00255 family)